MADPRDAVVEVMFVGVNMPLGAIEFKPPVIPGWRFVSATRQPFGAACIYRRDAGPEEKVHAV